MRTVAGRQYLSGWCRTCHRDYSREERRRYRQSHRAELPTDEWRRYHGRRRDPPIDWG